MDSKLAKKRVRCYNVVRGRERPRKVGNFEVVEEVKYLGVKVGGRGRNIFQKEKDAVIQKAQIKAAQLKSYI